MNELIEQMVGWVGYIARPPVQWQLLLIGLAFVVPHHLGRLLRLTGWPLPPPWLRGAWLTLALLAGTLNRVMIVELDVPAALLRERVGEGDGRPLWDPGDPVAWRMFLERRRAAYALADLRIAAGASPAARLAREIARRCE